MRGHVHHDTSQGGKSEWGSLPPNPCLTLRTDPDPGQSDRWPSKNKKGARC